MATNVGKVGIVMKGAWSNSATYDVLDAVGYNGGTYIAKQAVPANTVPTNTTYWQPACEPTVVTESVNLGTLYPSDLTGIVYLRKQNNIVTYNFFNLTVKTSTRSFADVIPSEYRPSESSASVRSSILNVADNTIAFVEMANTGAISFSNAITENKQYYGTYTAVI